MTKAEEFKKNFFSTSDLMAALDVAHIHSEQDYENESTTWYFDDGSFIKVHNTSIETGIQ